MADSLSWDDQVVPGTHCAETCPCKITAEEERKATKEVQMELERKIQCLRSDIQRLTQWDTNWDDLATHGITQSRDILLVRHGEYQSDQTPHYLTAQGIRQARTTGRRLNMLISRGIIHTTKIVHSGLMRAQQTAREICAQITPQVELEEDVILNEGYPTQDEQQFEEAFAKYFYRSGRNEPNVLVCHANIIRFFICRCIQIPTTAWERMAISHCSITQIRIHANGNTILRQLNLTDHLQNLVA